ncbi:MAG: DNA-processing protein DprA [Oscillospiraceae bacterium]|nr:DNA-processing protein DprA [Oscillospiraceae bacterium]
MDSRNVYEWLWIVSCVGCGNSRIWQIVADFSTVSEAYEFLNDKEKRTKLFNATECRNADRVTKEQIDNLISYCENKNIYILTCDDELYPDRLRNIYNPPAVLFCRGDISCLENDFSLSIVGTRKPSEYSVKVTASLVKELSKMGITIVSGFATGIDITANLAAVRSGGKTIAVLGCGLDHDYPKENSRYREEIEKNGLFISEYFPQFSGSHVSFPTRNRILSALSLGTIVAEAAIKSGALITANMALNQGKNIFAFAPHDLFDRRYGGNVALIRDGAICLCGVKDIVYEYYESYGHKIAKAQALDSVVIPDDLDENLHKSSGRIDPYRDIERSSPKPKKKRVKIKEQPKEETAEIPFSEPSFDTSVLDGEAASVYEKLKNEGSAVQADELAKICGMDISELLMLLTDLEIEGAVSSSAGNIYTAN